MGGVIVVLPTFFFSGGSAMIPPSSEMRVDRKGLLLVAKSPGKETVRYIEILHFPPQTCWEKTWNKNMNNIDEKTQNPRKKRLKRSISFPNPRLLCRYPEMTHSSSSWWECWACGGVHSHRATPIARWMVYFMEHPWTSMDDDYGYPHDLGKLHVAPTPLIIH